MTISLRIGVNDEIIQNHTIGISSMSASSSWSTIQVMAFSILSAPGHGTNTGPTTALVEEANRHSHSAKVCQEHTDECQKVLGSITRCQKTCNTNLMERDRLQDSFDSSQQFSRPMVKNECRKFRKYLIASSKQRIWTVRQKLLHKLKGKNDKHQTLACLQTCDHFYTDFSVHNRL